MPSNPRQRGYILVATLFMTFVVGVMLLALTRWWQIESQREKERELLWIGAQFRAALAGYAASTPSGGPCWIGVSITICAATAARRCASPASP